MSKLKSHIQSSLDHFILPVELDSSKPVVSHKPRFKEPSRLARGSKENGLNHGASKTKEVL